MSSNQIKILAIVEILESLEEVDFDKEDMDRKIHSAITVISDKGNNEDVMDVDRYPKYTSSLDDATSLHDRVLPGWAWRVATCSVSDDAWTIPDYNHPVHGEKLRKQFPQIRAQQDPLEYFDTDVDLRPSGRPAVALMISIFRALIKIYEHKRE